MVVDGQFVPCESREWRISAHDMVNETIIFQVELIQLRSGQLDPAQAGAVIFT